MKLRRVGAILRKELRHIARDPRSLAMALAMPLMMLLLFGYALTLDVDRIPLLIYDQDRSPASGELIERFRGSRYFAILGQVSAYRAIEREIDRGHALMALVIPHGYSRRLAAGEPAEVQILIDGSDSNTASIALGYAETLVRDYARELAAEARNRRGAPAPELPLEPRFRILFNSQMESKNYIVPGLIAVILMIIAALLTSLTIAREWEMGTMEQLLSTPLRPAELVLGKMLAFFLVGVADTAVATAVGLGIFRVPLRGSVLLFSAASAIFLCGAMCWGILISAAARSQVLAFQAGMMTTFLPAFLLSGFVYAIESMPLAVRVISYFFPTRYFVTTLKGIFLKGVGIEVLWPELLFLTVFAGLVFLLATRKVGGKLA